MKFAYRIPIKGGCYKMRLWFITQFTDDIISRTDRKYTDTSFRLIYK